MCFFAPACTCMYKYGYTYTRTYGGLRLCAGGPRVCVCRRYVEEGRKILEGGRKGKGWKRGSRMGRIEGEGKERARAVED